MTGWEEINVKFYVNQSEDIDTGVQQWCLLLTGADKAGGGHICQCWDHEPTQEEIEGATFAAKQGMRFITIHLAVERPPRYVQVMMPRIRINIVDTEEE